MQRNDLVLCILIHKATNKYDLPDDLGGEAEPRLLLARGDGDRLSLPAGLMEGSG